MSEKLSFYKLVSEKNYKIEIPIIQRDYAQGRESALEIRQQFLLALKDYLSNDKPIELDFIYGSIEGDGESDLFIPLDGQQRLTTLFLLHWYLANKENKLVDFRSKLLSNGKSKFSYETRASSREFCNQLLTNDIEIKGSFNQISESIKDADWFFLSWQNDPTIQSMLVVLDEIHKIFYKTNNFYEKLSDSENPVIGFQFIELENFGLTDSLYVKMNSRGKELTEFENFKAKFEQHIEKLDKENNTEFKDEFSQKIDKDWTDLFWNYRNTFTNVFDVQLMNFIRVLATNNYALQQSKKLFINKGDIRHLIESPKISFVKYESLNCLDLNCLRDIIQTLDYLKNDSKKINLFLEGTEIIDETELFEGVLENNLSYEKRILFFSLYKFLIVNNGDITNLYDWMRLIRNLTVNTIYNDADEYAKSLKTVNTLLNKSNDILNHFSSAVLKIDGFVSIQVLEERIKAVLIKKSLKWRKAIIEFEDHKYFIGQIDFLLDFSGIKEYYHTDKSLNWTDEEDEFFFEKFNEYGNKAAIMFSDSGLNDFGDYLWQRALLSKGNYTLTASLNNSFLIDYDRDVSWKRLLRNNSKQRNYIKLLWDDINIETTKQDLARIINGDDTKDWRRYFIKRPEIFIVCGYKKYIRFNNENNILLLEKSQTNGTHREYYSYALKVELQNLGNSVGYVSTSSLNYLSGIYSINGKSTFITYSGYSYSFEVSEKTYKYFKTEEEIIEYLKTNHFLN